MNDTRNTQKVPNIEKLGKECRELFNKDYTIDTFSLNSSTTTQYGVKYSLSGVHKNERINGILDTQHAFRCLNNAIALYHIKWTTENQLNIDVLLKNGFGKNADCNLGAICCPQKEQYGLGIGTISELDHFKSVSKASFTTCDSDMGCLLNVDCKQSIVFGSKGMFAGFDIGYNKLQNDAILNFIANKHCGNFIFHGNFAKNWNTFSNPYEFGFSGSMFTTIIANNGRKLDWGVAVEIKNYDIKLFGYGLEYKYNENWLFKVKTEFWNGFAVSVVKNLSPSILLTVSYMFNRNETYKRHLIGMGLDLEF